MWEWEFETGRKQRNGTHPIKSIDGTVTRASFPSWSWMGWTGGGQIHSQTNWISPPHYPSFYIFDLAAELVAIQHEQRVIEPKPLAELLANSETGNGDTKWRKDITEADFTPALISTPAKKHSALLFYTQTAKVKYEPTIAADDTSRFGTPSNVKRTDQTYLLSVMIRSKFYEIHEEHQRKGHELTGILEEVTLAVVFAERTLNTSFSRGEFKLYCWPIIERDGMWMRTSYMSTVISLDIWKILPQKSWELICMI